MTIFLDNQATTPLDPRVAEAMAPLLAGYAGNPHSTHALGRAASAGVEAARAQVAALIGAETCEIVFTSGATEANNLAILGIAASEYRRGNHLITCATEHKAVLSPFHHLESAGFRVDVLPVGTDGLVDPSAIARAIGDDTALVSIMAANNEIGVLQPIAEIARLCRKKGVVFHTDAAQAAGKIDLRVHDLGIDLLSISGHKLYGPVGAGALFISESAPIRPEPLFHGGAQELGMRPGTVSPLLTAGLGAACAAARADMAADAARAKALLERFWKTVSAGYPKTRIVGSTAHRLPGNLSLCLPGVPANPLIDAMQPALAVSSGSACSAGSTRPSHVLMALGMSEADALSTLRISAGRFTTEADVDRAARLIVEHATAMLRGHSSGARITAAAS